MRNKIFGYGRFIPIMAFLLLTSFLPKPERPSEEIDPELHTQGLYFAEFYDYIFRGHFEHVPIPRTDMFFSAIFDKYLRAFGSQCPEALPADKVEIMNWVCATERVVTNGYGVETSRTCVEWEMVGSGLYARPDLYEAKLTVDKLQGQEVLATTMAMITDPNAMGNSVDRIHKAKGLINDMDRFFGLNPCTSEGVRRFEENLKRYALGQEPIRMAGTSPYQSMKTSGGPTGPQDLNRLTEDLVADQGKTWAFNRYIPGSISGLRKVTDAQGRPRELSADYQYKGFGGASAGSVRITFKNGLPKCIYFFDFPQNCKTPNSGILAGYAQGKYAQ